MAKKTVDPEKLLKEMDNMISKIKKDPKLEKQVKEAEKKGKKLAKDNAKVDDK